MLKPYPSQDLTRASDPYRGKHWKELQGRIDRLGQKPAFANLPLDVQNCYNCVSMVVGQCVVVPRLVASGNKDGGCGGSAVV